MTSNPEFIRVKRRRDEEPVGALLIDENKRSKTGKFIYKNTATVILNKFEDNNDDTPLLKLSNHDDQRHFILETHNKKRRHSEANEQVNDPNNLKNENTLPNTLPNEISKMLNDYLALNTDQSNGETRKKKPSRKHFKGESATVLSLPSQDYVYDIYHLEPLNEKEIPPDTKLGHVKIVNIDVELINDEKSDTEDQFPIDDDSNSENFYRNDYPEDEDDDRSILFGSDVDYKEIESEIKYLNEYRKQDFDPEEQYGYDDANEVINVMKDDFSDLFDKFGASADILNSINTSNFIDLDKINEEEEDDDYADNEADYEYGYQDNEYDYEGNNTDYYAKNEPSIKRSIFFKSDEDDPVAIHRDKIFGKLQAMIDKSDDTQHQQK
ncbi:hypothetical protein TPHA_0G00950 [Tetrapisispora phaffii CBS 4417]|uniref:Transcription factor Iwr1 domain-containing protein n=1 Tax=Tetrapisispora phaffii (strain ATCC 24235 / CBS 4417 / NBRC 1672 / NRRL Y-8282 / UCD 70-5) TaxID=1071381 RepID=G8BVK3_TETPH|nr:hypothetical protein TPHA_0G00950 [Tetrapisispora phaffii CBS 4417]CCE63931.1 hypothetical protein TPHA_0G00950 [Tetrapisispora phaffii CBS 4417]